MTTTTALTEEQPWNPNDPMPAWVCAIGGYEVLREGDAELAKTWFIMHGQKRHPPINGSGLSQNLAMSRVATHFGFLWWGSPHSWPIQWPPEWDQMLLLEEFQRETTGFARLNITANRGVQHRMQKRKGRRR